MLLKLKKKLKQKHQKPKKNTVKIEMMEIVWHSHHLRNRT